MSEQHKRPQYSGVSRSSRLPVSLHRTRARRRREALLAVILSSIGLVLLAGLGVLAWYVVGFVTSGDGPEAAADEASTNTPTLSVTTDYEVEPLVDLIMSTLIHTTGIDRGGLYLVREATNEIGGLLFDPANLVRQVPEGEFE